MGRKKVGNLGQFRNQLRESEAAVFVAEIHLHPGIVPLCLRNIGNGAVAVVREAGGQPRLPLAVLAGAGAVIGRVTADESSGTDHADVVAFRGEHQAGITTPAQDRMHFVAFDVTTKSRDELITLLQTWTAMAERMTAGQEATEDGATGDGPYAPPSDTGEALDLAPSQLTLTIGFGPSLFDDRFGLADKKPAALLDLPHFRADNLDPNRSGGDIAIQACANDPQVAVHAIRNLALTANSRDVIFATEFL